MLGRVHVGAEALRSMLSEVESTASSAEKAARSDGSRSATGDGGGDGGKSKHSYWQMRSRQTEFNVGSVKPRAFRVQSSSSSSSSRLRARPAA